MGTFLMPWLHLWPGTQREKQRRCQALTGVGYQAFHRYLRLIGVMSYRPPDLSIRQQILATIEESRRRGNPPSVMVVANHPTLVDTTAIMASFPYLIVVAKSSVYHFPLLRLLLQFCGHTAANSDLAGEAALAEQLIERMKNGESVLLFPESTRSPNEGPRPFRRGPFEIAARAGAAIQPLVVDSGPGLLKAGLAWYDVPPKITKYELRALAPLFPSRSAQEPCRSGKEPYLEQEEHNIPGSQAPSGRQLAQRVFDQISSALRTKEPA
jgi:1-acyl-sn-glycerol-3-phosphate acyltransferase